MKPTFTIGRICAALLFAGLLAACETTPKKDDPAKSNPCASKASRTKPGNPGGSKAANPCGDKSTTGTPPESGSNDPWGGEPPATTAKSDSGEGWW